MRRLLVLLGIAAAVVLAGTATAQTDRAGLLDGHSQNVIHTEKPDDPIFLAGHDQAASPLPRHDGNRVLDGGVLVHTVNRARHHRGDYRLVRIQASGNATNCEISVREDAYRLPGMIGSHDNQGSNVVLGHAGRGSPDALAAGCRRDDPAADPAY